MIRSASNDFLPDEGVVPYKDDQKKYGIKVVLTKWHHTNMTDKGPLLVKKEITKEVEKFLDENVGCD